MNQKNPSDEVPEKQKGDRDALTEFIKEVIGYEQGLWRTLVDLRKKPMEVLDGYLTGSKTYTSPFKLLTTSLSLWILFNSFLIDWYAIWNQLTTDVIHAEANLIMWIKDYDDTRRMAFDKKLAELAAPVIRIVSRVSGDLFSKWYVPFAVASIIGGSWWFVRRNKDSGVTMKKALAVLSYSVGSNMTQHILLSISFGIHLYLGIGLSFAVGLLMLLGKTEWFIYAPPGKFFSTDNRQIEKRLMRSTFVVMLILQSLLAVGYVLYFL